MNYKVLDMVPIEIGRVPAPATTFTKQKLSFPTKTIKEAGYMFVYLSYDNDSNNWVYFDDLKVTHTKTNFIQYNEYYPFGLQTAGSWTREDATDNKFLYNGGAELNATTSWYETFFRGYDATLGSFLQVDPLAAHASSFTPYNYAFNNPVMFNDPMGDYPQEVKDEMEKYGWGSGPSYNYETDFSGGNGGNGRYRSGVFINPSRPGSYQLFGMVNAAEAVKRGEMPLESYAQTYGTSLYKYSSNLAMEEDLGFWQLVTSEDAAPHLSFNISEKFMSRILDAMRAHQEYPLLLRDLNLGRLIDTYRHLYRNLARGNSYEIDQFFDSRGAKVVGANRAGGGIFVRNWYRTIQFEFVMPVPLKGYAPGADPRGIWKIEPFYPAYNSLALDKNGNAVPTGWDVDPRTVPTNTPYPYAMAIVGDYGGREGIGTLYFKDLNGFIAFSNYIRN